MRRDEAQARWRTHSRGRTELVRFIGSVGRAMMGRTSKAGGQSASGSEILGTEKEGRFSVLLHVEGVQAGIGPVANPRDTDAHRLSVAFDQTATLPSHRRTEAGLHHWNAV